MPCNEVIRNWGYLPVVPGVILKQEHHQGDHHDPPHRRLSRLWPALPFRPATHLLPRLPPDGRAEGAL